jgi:hypothetical protein
MGTGKKIFILFFVVVIVVFFYIRIVEKPIKGINVGVRNYTTENFLLELKVYDQSGINLISLSMPIKNDMKKPNVGYTFDFYNDKDYNFDFEKFVLDLKLIHANGSEAVYEKIYFWPGDAGTSYAASSNRVLVTIQIKKVNNKYILDLTGDGYL